MLNFWAYTYTTGIGSTQTVEIYGAAGDNPTIVTTEDVSVWDLKTTGWSTPYAWRYATVDVSQFAGKKVVIGWYYQTGYSGKDFVLDDISLVVGPPLPKTTLSIGTIGYGKSITTTVFNTGPNITAHDVKWTINVKGGRGKIDVTSKGNFTQLYYQGHRDDRGTISSGSYKGFGPVEITITVRTKDALPSEMTRHAQGFVIFSKCYPLVFSNESWINWFL